MCGGRALERKLTTILCGDVVGYSRLMGEDEEATLELLRSYRADIEGLISTHSGRVFGGAGDSIIAEFASPVEAVRCANDVQVHLKKRNADLEEPRRMLFRIGINLGDVMVDGDDLMGDGVNVAARLEALAEPGGICLSESVAAQVARKVDLQFESLGPQRLKNIAEPVVAYRVVLGQSPTRRDASLLKHTRYRISAVIAVLVAAGAIAAAWLWWPQGSPPGSGPADDRPSVVVLPFDNLSGDPDEDHISDGISEDLSTDLSRVRGLFVFSRSVADEIKPRIAPGRRDAVDPVEVSAKLGADYILEGSVRRSGDKLRINAQLIDGTTGGHLWAERFDRESKDVFVVLDEVILQIVNALKVQLTAGERQALSDARPVNPDAWDLVLRGIAELRRYTKETNEEARRYFLEATKFDPEYARAYANVAFTYSIELPFGWTNDPEESLRLAVEYAERANKLDDRIVQVQLVLSNIYVRQKRFDEAIAAAERSVEIDPNYADGYAALTLALLTSGRAEEALAPIREALRLDPRGPFFYHWLEGRCYFMLGRYEEALDKMQLVVDRNPEFIGGLKYLAATQAHLGQIDDADWTAEEILTIQPGITLAQERETDFAKKEDTERYIEGLRLAGIPE